MKYIDEYRDKRWVDSLIKSIHREVTHRWTLMEICGGQTHTILKYNLQDMLPEGLKLIHGPGCPVCVTSLEWIDMATQLGGIPGVILTSFGDMLRVPGSHDDLLSIKAKGGDIRMVYSPLDALQIAQRNPGKEVVFFGVGFETTAPAVALAIRQAHLKGIPNFSVLCSHVLVPPAIEMLLASGENLIEGILAAGHVCTVMGIRQYTELADNHRIPVVVTGFEPVDILTGILRTVQMLERGEFGVVNAYKRSVRPEGNLAAQELLKEVFVPVDRNWRGIGTIPKSGLALSGQFREYDAAVRFHLDRPESEEPSDCMAGQVLTGKMKPDECPAFGLECSPERPLGAPMVSSEGACAAYYRYRRYREKVE